MKKGELKKIINGEAYLDYIGNLFEYSHTKHGYHFFLNVNDGHDIDFREETILNCPNHFRLCRFEDVSR